MSFIKKIFPTLGLGVLLLPTLFSCGQKGDYIYLRVLNSEDYIYKYDPDEGCKDPDLTVQFENYINPNREAQGKKKVKVIYDTFDTMENMFNILETGKTKYDLICASEYMIQKMSKLKMIKPIDLTKIPNYEVYGSKFIKDKFESIKYKNKDNQEVKMSDYCICYMWGTLGLIYNPNFSVFKNKGYTKEEVINDMNSFDSLWNKKYNKTIAIKDSMRDTYAIGLIHKYKNELAAAKTQEEKDIIFNWGGEDDPDAKTHINAVKDDLLELRKNIYGFEVDSGKEDIVKGTSFGIDTAWSGDAVKSINDGEEFKTELYYSLPKEGVNLWFDCWSMQENDHEDVAYEFLDFISAPENAIQNMDYIGYTSGIAGEDIFDWFQNEKYKPEEGAEIEDYDVSYFFGDNHILKVDSSLIGRQITAQFPSTKDFEENKLMVMKDYGKNNDLILKMWEEVKHESLPVWAIILFSVEIAIAAGAITFIIVKKHKDKKMRKERKLKKVA